ncbi:MAG: ABC transporter ATP-binding protein [Bacteroidetes bacterium]|nr:MAG: ABC transporter ATP-binding protein [Bacteroidota bacterium]
MLTLDKLGIEFSGRWLIRQASYQFNPGERIGLIGRNGAGKSTLLRVIAGEMSPSEGQLHQAGQLKIAFFNQDLLSFETDRSIFEVAREAFAPLLALQAEIDTLHHRLEGGETDPALWDALAAKQAAFETQGGTRMDAAVHSMLRGLGFSDAERDMPYHTFSGGWRMRVLLAQMLLTDPDVLLLDEPTNHLDLPSIQWLETYLKTFRGTCIVVSHDRFFIDRIANKILEISLQALHTYNGNYSFYLQEKALRQEQHQRAYENQQKFITEQERFINRFRAKATKATQVQSRVKALERLERIPAPEEEVVKLSFRFEVGVPSGKEVLRLRNIDKAYGDKHILEQTSATIMRGDKIALIGANGLGKSTLLRILAGTEPHRGRREPGHQVVQTFFAQHQLEALTLSHDILTEVSQAATNKTERELRTLLGCFMFTGDDVEKPIRVLSGGEKSRVALAKTLLSRANLLLLDEPTNHLDIPSIQILVEALQAYEGTYVVVSHDRFFLEKVANKIWYLEERQIKEYPGTYAEYEAWQARMAADAALTNSALNPAEPAPREQTAATANEPGDYQRRKQARNRAKKLEREIAAAESRIEALEAEVAEAEAHMARPEVAADYEQFSAAQAKYEALQAEVHALTESWEAMHMELEELEVILG